MTQTDCEGRIENGIVSGCLFTHCTGTSFGGGGLRLDRVDPLTIRSCFFYNCHSGTGGGAMYWYFETTEQNLLTYWILDCVFALNSAKSSHDIYIDAKQSIRYVTIFDDSSYTLTNKSNRVRCTSNYRDDWLPCLSPIQLVPSDTDILSLDFSDSSSSSSSISTCFDDLSIPCQTVTEVMSVVNTLNESVPLHILLLDGRHISTEWNVIHRQYTFISGLIASSTVCEIVNER